MTMTENDKLRAVMRSHVADLRRCADILDKQGVMQATAAEIRKAADELEAALAALSEQPEVVCSVCEEVVEKIGQGYVPRGHGAYSKPGEQPEAQGVVQCGCQNFCEDHGREFIEVTEAGEEYCHECTADGFGGELCSPMAGSCDMLFPKANEYQRSFMCPAHAAENVEFCRESYAERAKQPEQGGEAVAELRKLAAQNRAGLADALNRSRKIDRLLHEIAYTAAPKVAEPEAPAPANHCPITGRKFFANVEHPELGMVATYGGPFDSYTIPAYDREDKELRCERYDWDADHWIEGGEPVGYVYANQRPEAAPKVAGGVAGWGVFDGDGNLVDVTVCPEVKTEDQARKVFFSSGPVRSWKQAQRLGYTLAPVSVAAAHQQEADRG